jgi:hypothetical protein
MNQSLVIYEHSTVSVITDHGIFYHSIRSNTPELISEEIKSFIKSSTNSSFLHAPDFQHLIIGENHLLLPSVMFDEALLTSYYQRMYDNVPTHSTLAHHLNERQQVHILYTQQSWLNTLLTEQFNNVNVNLLHDVIFTRNHRVNTIQIDLHFFTTHAYIGIQQKEILGASELFEYSEIDDVVFMLLTILTKQNINPAGGKIRLSSISTLHTVGKIEHLLRKLDLLSGVEIIHETSYDLITPTA